MSSKPRTTTKATPPAAATAPVTLAAPEAPADVQLTLSSKQHLAVKQANVNGVAFHRGKPTSVPAPQARVLLSKRDEQRRPYVEPWSAAETS